jgi:hypothetical protein
MAEEMDLNMLGLARGGRKSQPLHGHIIRELTGADLETLKAERGSTTPHIKRLREKHHGLAKALVDGVSEGDAAAIYGYSASRVSILKADPSFQELLNFYREGKTERYYELHDRIADLGADAVDELSSRLEDDPESITVGQLLEIGKMSLDRSGHGPSTNTNVNVKVGLADKLEAARKRALQHRSAQLVEGKAVDVTPEDSE